MSTKKTPEILSKDEKQLLFIKKALQITLKAHTSLNNAGLVNDVSYDLAMAQAISNVAIDLKEKLSNAEFTKISDDYAVQNPNISGSPYAFLKTFRNKAQHQYHNINSALITKGLSACREINKHLKPEFDRIEKKI